MKTESIKATREALGLGQGEFGQLLGVQQTTISRWERGREDPSAYHQALIGRFAEAAQVYNVCNELPALLVGKGAIEALRYLLQMAERERSEVKIKNT